MNKINKLFVQYDHFSTNCEGIYLTTFQNNVKRALKCDSKGYFFILNKEKNYITEQSEINRINEFINF